MTRKKASSSKGAKKNGINSGNLLKGLFCLGFAAYDFYLGTPLWNIVGVVMIIASLGFFSSVKNS